MPFLEGVPCSIHGVVFPEGAATFRPVEMVTLRRPGSSRLRYAGAATFWDPPAADREVMRDLARRVGEGCASGSATGAPSPSTGCWSKRGLSAVCRIVIDTDRTDVPMMGL
jgi:hypothetical protein